nr:ABC transporter ATP-binding protein [Thermus islandicus]
MLEVRNLSRSFGGLTALKGVSLHVAEGEIVAIIGPNGAGKSTLFNCISGFLPPSQGEVRFHGEEITRLAPEEITRRGLARTFQIPRVFGGMSVLENVLVGSLLRSQRVTDARMRALKVLEQVGLLRPEDPVEALGIAARKRLELARALATEPKLLLLDEVAGGLNPAEAESLVGVLQSLHRAGVTLVLVEHVLEVVMRLAHRVVVLDYGETIAEGSPEEIVRHPRVIEAYLGRRGRA